ncbi:MAG: hypothetical protein HRT45_16835, partial [Bdellovibrionales bacterium]|nr:hypothetical protein [Bdellovibrionales bacterium]
MRNQPKHLIILFSLIVSQLAFSSPADLSQVYFQSLDHIQQAKENKSNQGLEDFILRLNSDNINPRLRNILLKAFFDATYGRREFDSTAYQVLDRSQLYRFSLSQHILLYLHKQDLLDQPIVVDDWLLERHINDEWEQSFLREDLYTLCNLMPQQKAVLSWVFEKNPQLELQCKSLSHHLNILPPNSEQLRDLVKLAPDVETFASGQYHRKPRMYQFCRVNRDFHCRMLMMDENKQWVRDSQGNLWNLPVLGRSRRELPFNQYGGHTPAGIYTIDGVMPEANKQQVFGKYRRLIMEFIRNSDEEAELKKLIPPSNHNANWWTESTIARDVG